MEVNTNTYLFTTPPNIEKNLEIDKPYLVRTKTKFNYYRMLFTWKSNMNMNISSKTSSFFICKRLGEQKPQTFLFWVLGLFNLFRRCLNMIWSFWCLLKLLSLLVYMQKHSYKALMDVANIPRILCMHFCFPSHGLAKHCN